MFVFSRLGMRWSREKMMMLGHETPFQPPIVRQINGDESMVLNVDLKWHIWECRYYTISVRVKLGTDVVLVFC